MSDTERKFVWKEQPLWWHKQGRQQTASGYGTKLISSRMVRLEGETIWRRVYVTQWSNSGSAFVRLGGKQLYIFGDASFGWWNEHHPVRRVTWRAEDGILHVSKAVDFWHRLVNEYPSRGYGSRPGLDVGGYRICVSTRD